MKNIYIKAAIISIAALSSQIAFSTDKKAKPELMMGANASMLSNTCAVCHGPNGASRGPGIPTIAGLSSDYFVDVMEGFKTGDVPSTIMDRIAKGYTSEEFKLMADFYAKKSFVVAKGQASDPKLAKKGGKLHEKYCEKCHSDGGRLAVDDAGILTGQWKAYTQATLEDFISGDRKAPKKMAKKLQKLIKKEGDKGIKALLEFYAH